ncbi:MAG: hypothetical protein AB8F74_20480, partial [Saprospiraceae bacterium]
MNKQDIITNIQNNLTNNPNVITDVEHEACLFGANSALEVVYGETILEQSSSLDITNNGDFSYNLYFQKTGRIISVTGVFSATDIVFANGLIATITDSDWVAQANTFNGTAFTQSGETVRFYINGNEIKIGVPVLNAETFFIN